ncbi:LysM domain/BON superfamily protein [Blautia hydrogenotrophica]|uniref:LysM peptidoglycan-binding domain-containing protein n=1 Tax=Blautia hydrogenotrophica TaxID=53443 RepID=UPI0006C72FDD|nr:LysM peptidoglycan-binding domain-containing protein [Blautia hydrogenotrophica]CUM94761.1 LysM domain/BON superfamily protein [Blautia hydrogenotrophica]SCH45929.1 LysM domain/BON superfamily protein [uncultured Blautia sp.]
MIEVIYKEDKCKAQGNEQFFHIPKNIRQIGLISEEHKIYIEDYAYTFLGRIAAEQPMKGRLAVLLGQSNWAEGTSYIFIRCALQVQEMDISPEHLNFSDEVWGKVNEQMEEYFPGQEVVGWFFSAPQISMEVTDVIYRTHMNSFGGNDKVLFLMEPQEKEEAFFRYENGHMAKQLGYYVYYEKNPMMQEYMIAMNQEQESDSREKVTDDAVLTFRSKVRRKQEKRASEEQKKMSAVMYAASACLALAVLAVGVNFVNRYDKMQQISGQAKQVSVQPETKSATPKPEENAKITEKLMEENNTEKETLTILEKDKEKTTGETPTPTVAEKEDKQKSETAQNQDMEEKPDEADDAKKTEETGGEVHESYTIRPGDTLFKISIQRYGDMSEISEICRLNGISEDDIIYPGQTILLP